MLLLSLVAHAPEPYELVVATDRPECFVWFGTRVRDRVPRLRARSRPGAGRSRSRCAQKLEADPAPTGPASGADRPARCRRARARAARRLRRARCSAGDLFMHKQEYSSCRRAAARQPQALGVAARPLEPAAKCAATTRCGIQACLRRLPRTAGCSTRRCALRRARRRRRAALRDRAARRRRGPRPHRPPAAGGASGSPTTGATSPATTPRSPAAWPRRSSKACR